MSTERPLLRAAVLVAAGLGTVFALSLVWQWWRIPRAHRDGLELIGLAVAGLYLVFLVLPTLVLGLLGRWLPLAAILAAVALVVASDTLLPWVPWPSVGSVFP
jgi:hypothetical protein